MSTSLILNFGMVVVTEVGNEQVGLVEAVTITHAAQEKIVVLLSSSCSSKLKIAASFEECTQASSILVPRLATVDLDPLKLASDAARPLA